VKQTRTTPWYGCVSRKLCHGIGVFPHLHKAFPSAPISTEFICQQLDLFSFTCIVQESVCQICVAMATKAVWVKAMLMVAALGVAAHVQASVTIYNPVGLVVDVVVDGTNVKVVTEVMTVNITQGQQDIQFKVAEGQVLEVNVHEGDVLVLIPDPTDPLHAVQALKIQVGAPPKPSPLLPESDTTHALAQAEESTTTASP
jgi:hypothetical protein